MLSRPSSLRVAIHLPRASAAEIVAIIDVLDQILEQLWREHGDDITDFMLADRRRRDLERAQQDFPF
jgi:hypothetical protein